jgi:hypothetical protein
VQLAVQSEQRTTVKEEQRKAQKEQNALKSALPAMSQNHGHPEKRQQRSGSENKKLEAQRQTASLARILPLPSKHGNIQVQDFSCIT